MKKVLALVLAVVLAFGMSSVAFAATNQLDTIGDAAYDDLKTDNKDNDILYPGSTTKYDSIDGAVLKTFNFNKDNNSSLRVVWEKGGDAVEYMRLKYVDIKNRTDGEVTEKNHPYIELKLKENYTLVDGKDLQAKLTHSYKIGGKGNALKDEYRYYGKIANDKDTVSIVTYATSKEAKENDMITVLDNTVYVAEDQSGYFTFGDSKRLIQVLAKATKNQKMFLYFNENVIAEVADKYDDIDAQIAYYNLPAKPEFSKDAVVTIDCDFVGKPYIYEYNNGKLTKIDAKWDNANGTFTFNTKVLTSYVVSDKELVTGTDDGTTTPNNPDTGANDFVGLAVALAVVSIAGIAVAKRK